MFLSLADIPARALAERGSAADVRDEVRLVRKGVEARAELGKDHGRRTVVDAVDLRHVEPAADSHEIGLGPGVSPVLLPAPAIVGRRIDGRKRFGDLCVHGADLHVVVRDAPVEEAKRLVCLPEVEQVLFAPVPRQFLGYFGFAPPAAPVAQCRQRDGTALARDYGGQYPHAGDAVDVGHRMVQADVHLVQRLLDGLDRLRAHPLDVLAFADDRAHGVERVGRTERAAQKSAAVQPLQPLAVLDVALAARDHLDGAGVHKDAFDAGGFERVVDGNPEYARRLHRGGFHLALFHPCGHAQEFVCRRPEMLDVVRAVILARSADVMVRVSRKIDARHMSPHLVESVCLSCHVLPFRWFRTGRRLRRDRCQVLPGEETFAANRSGPTNEHWSRRAQSTHGALGSNECGSMCRRPDKTP